MYWKKIINKARWMNKISFFHRHQFFVFNIINMNETYFLNVIVATALDRNEFLEHVERQLCFRNIYSSVGIIDVIILFCRHPEICEKEIISDHWLAMEQKLSFHPSRVCVCVNPIFFICVLWESIIFLEKYYILLFHDLIIIFTGSFFYHSVLGVFFWRNKNGWKKTSREKKWVSFLLLDSIFLNYPVQN